VIAYFDTSAIVPLLIEEAASYRAARLWDEADRVASVRLVYAEGHAALAQANRLGRIDAAQLHEAVAGLVDCYQQLDLLEVSDHLVRRAGNLAEAHNLRGYDAVHLAGAEALLDDELVFVAGDGPLCDAAAAVGIAVSRTIVTNEGQ
jgi:hypothetical protein